MWKRITFLLLLPIGTIAQRFPSPGIAFSTTFDDAAPEGIALLGNAAVYVTSNQQWMDGTFSQSWVHKLDPNSGDILQSRLLAQDRSKIGACTVLSPTAGGPRMLIINPWTGDADFNVGIQAIRTDTLQTLWTSNIVREADTGIPPIISPDEDIVYYSSSNGIAVLDKEGRTRWATTTIRTGQIAVTRTSIFAVDQTPREQYPLNVYSLVSGALTGTSGPLEGAPTSAGVVLSPDERSAYTVRSGTNGGLYQNRANFLFVPPTILTTDISSAYRFGPLISPEGNITYVINTLDVLIEAYHIVEKRSLWRATVCPPLPPLLSRDGTALYTLSCGREIVRLDTSTGDIVWSFQALPAGFLVTSMVLADNDKRLLVTGKALSSRTGYAYSFFTEDATFSPTISPTQTKSPVPAPVAPPTPIDFGAFPTPLQPSDVSSPSLARGNFTDVEEGSGGSKLSSSWRILGISLWWMMYFSAL